MAVLQSCSEGLWQATPPLYLAVVMMVQSVWPVFLRLCILTSVTQYWIVCSSPWCDWLFWYCRRVDLLPSCFCSLFLSKSMVSPVSASLFSVHLDESILQSLLMVFMFWFCSSPDGWDGCSFFVAPPPLVFSCGISACCFPFWCFVLHLVMFRWICHPVCDAGRSLLASQTLTVCEQRRVLMTTVDVLDHGVHECFCVFIHGWMKDDQWVLFL